MHRIAARTPLLQKFSLLQIVIAQGVLHDNV
jgi:hypothetical protein